MNTNLKISSRLHHNAHVAKDMEATRKFYEEIIGFPLVATWCEKTEFSEKNERTCIVSLIWVMVNDQRANARSELKRWLAGDHSPNNEAYHR